MFAQVDFPQTLHPEALDRYLEDGWFRMGQSIFTTNFLNFNNQFYSAIWLRLVLSEFSITSTQQKLLKLNSTFTSEIQPASITPEKEKLYAEYRQSKSFNASSSLCQLMMGASAAPHTIYNTYEVTIYDSGNLIAVGFFDIGSVSAAGITSFYNPAYKKYSLGKYLIYLKIEYCKKLNLQYFYPGYFVPGYTVFDYKLSLSKAGLQYLQFSSQQWLDVRHYSSLHNPLVVMRERLGILQGVLQQSNFESRLYYYEFFDAHLVPELKGIELFDFPVFLYCVGVVDESINPIVAYDVSSEEYHLLQCRSLWTSNAENLFESIYASHLLQVEQEVMSTARIEEIVSTLVVSKSESEKH
jgi:arginyl-tRNA--protein-N-Asp/Glu arginylyltransferase